MTNKIQSYYDEILLKFSLRNCKKDLRYLIEFSIKEDKIQFETENIENKVENSIINFSKAFLCSYYFYKTQNIEISVKKFKNNGIHFIKHKIEDNPILSLSTILTSENFTLEFPLNKKIENSEILIIKAENTNKNNNSLIDYLSSGISFDSYIGIDFSDKKLHNVDIRKNQYMNAIKGFRETLFEYVRNFEVYAYGAWLQSSKSKKTNAYFNLSLDENKSLFGFNEIKKAYQGCLNQIGFYENNNGNILSTLLNKVKERIFEKKNFQKYNILFLLINNSPIKEDYQNCIDAFIQISFLPLSIIIIGIGEKEDEFKKIRNLYYDKKYSSDGIEKKRDNIFFISMKECNYDENLLKNICLKEVPEQMIQFYDLSNITPQLIKEKNFKNIYNSFKILNESYNQIIRIPMDYESAPSLININNKEIKITPTNKDLDNNNNSFNNEIFSENTPIYEKTNINNVNEFEKKTTTKTPIHLNESTSNDIKYNPYCKNITKK